MITVNLSIGLGSDRLRMSRDFDLPPPPIGCLISIPRSHCARIVGVTLLSTNLAGCYEVYAECGSTKESELADIKHELMVAGWASRL